MRVAIGVYDASAAAGGKSGTRRNADRISGAHKVVSSRRAVGAVENHKSEISPEVNAGFLPRKE